MSTKRSWVTAISVALGLGLCSTPAVAGPTVINHCQTLPVSGSYVLGKNLTAAGGRGGLDCLRLADDFITIDLNGFTITGSGGQGAGIKLASNFGGAGRGFEIRGGTIAFFARGIDLRVLGGSPGQNRIERMRVQENSDFGVAISGGAIVKDSIFSKNGICIFLDGCPTRTTNGDGLSVGPDSVVTGNASSGNAGHGIFVSGGTVIGNTADGNGESGLTVNGASTVQNNTAAGNEVGLAIGCPSVIVGNTAINNATNLALQGAGCTAANNVAP
jgi:parallel beta-helix repeat protein